jgi:hypothetical protein
VQLAIAARIVMAQAMRAVCAIAGLALLTDLDPYSGDSRRLALLVLAPRLEFTQP